MMLVLPVLLSKKNIFVFLILGFLLLAVVFKDSPQRLELDKENFSKARLKLMQVKALSSTDSCRDDDGVCSEGCSPENDTDCVQWGVNTKIYLGYPSWGFDVDAFKNEVDELASRGVKWVKLGVRNVTTGWDQDSDAIIWNYAHLEEYDEALNYARGRGMKIWLASVTPHWASNFSQQKYEEVTKNYFKFLANRYSNSVDIWQAFNEANCHNYRTYDGIDSASSTYLEELKNVIAAARDGIKSINPDARFTVNVGGYSFYDEWKQFFDVMDPVIDAISLDIYPMKGENIINGLDSIIEEFKKYGKPVYIAETGLPTTANFDDYDGQIFSEQDQAKYVSRYLDEFKKARVDLVFLYEYRDEDQWLNWNPKEAVFGIKKGDGSRKESYEPIITRLKSSCENDDGFCPSGCISENDNDCLKLVVRAKGDYYQGWPHMQVYVDDLLVAETTVEYDTYTDYAFVVGKNIQDKISVVFTNDLYGGSEEADRNLWVDYIAVGGIVFEAESLGTEYDKFDPFDREDVIDGQESLNWGGALHFYVGAQELKDVIGHWGYYRYGHEQDLNVDLWVNGLEFVSCHRVKRLVK